MKRDHDEATLQGVLNAARDEDETLMELDARLQAAGLDRWLAGDLSAEEVQQLQQRASQDPELAEAMKLFAPTPAADHALAEAVVATMPAAATHHNDLARARARRRPLRLRRWAPALAVAAAAAVFILVSANDNEPKTSLPSYTVLLRGGEASTRGEAPSAAPKNKPWDLRADGPFEIVLRPQTAAAQPVAVAAFVRFPADGVLQAWPVVFETGQSGAARLVGAGKTLFAGQSGVGDLVFVIHPAATAGPSADAVTRGQLPAGARKVIVPVRLLTHNLPP